MSSNTVETHFSVPRPGTLVKRLGQGVAGIGHKVVGGAKGVVAGVKDPEQFTSDEGSLENCASVLERHPDTWGPRDILHLTAGISRTGSRTVGELLEKVRTQSQTPQKLTPP